jgi:hypothetical protein
MPASMGQGASVADRRISSQGGKLMHDKLFHVPVAIKLEGNVDCQVSSLADMAVFLQAWPEYRRGKLYRIAETACDNAVRGYITTDQARDTLVTFAQAIGALREDVESEVVGRTVVRGYGGFAA